MTWAHLRPGRFQALEAEVAVSVCAAAAGEVAAYGSVPLPGVDQRGVDLVGEDPAAVPVDHVGQLGDLLRGEDPAERVVRVAEDEQVPAGPEGVLDRVQVEGEEAVLVEHPDLDDLAAEVARHGQERHVRGRGQDDRRAGPGEVRDGELQRLDHVRDVVDVARDRRPSRTGARMEVRAGRGQLIGQHRGQVAEVRVGRQRGQRVQDGRRGAEVHLGHGRAEPVRARGGPLEAAAGAQRRRRGLVDGLPEGFWHIVILAPGRPGPLGQAEVMPEEVLTAPRVITGSETVADGAVVLGDRLVAWVGPRRGAAGRVRGAGRGRITRGRRSCPG